MTPAANPVPRSRSEVEKVPAVLVGMGSLVGILLGGIIGLPFAFLAGQLVQGVWSALLSGVLGSLSGIAYYLYKPLNPFSDNLYAPKSFERLTTGEVRALGYQNSPAARWIAILAAAPISLMPAVGAICWQSGWGVRTLESDPRRLDWVLPGAIWCAIFAVVNYFFVSCRVLWKRWDWIQKTQPLPERRVLAKYAKGKDIGTWDHLYKTEYSEQMDQLLRGVPGKTALKWLLLVLGPGLVVLSLWHLVVDGQAPKGRALLFLAVLVFGLGISWFGSRMRSDTHD